MAQPPTGIILWDSVAPEKRIHNQEAAAHLRVLFACRNFKDSARKRSNVTRRDKSGHIESRAGVEQADANCSELSAPYSTLVAFSMMVGWTENLERTKEMLEVLRNVVHVLHGGAIRAAALGETHGDQ